MAVLTGVKVSVEDTSSLTDDDAANIVQQLLKVLEPHTLSITYAGTDPEITVTVT